MKSLLPPFLRTHALRLGAILLAVLFASSIPAIAADPSMAITAIALGGVLDVATVAPLNGWKQLGAAHWIGLDQHRFSASAHGQLEHYTGESLRAVVPPEGWEEYAKLWPEAQAVIDQLTIAPAKKKKGKGGDAAATDTAAPPAAQAESGPEASQS